MAFVQDGQSEVENITQSVLRKISKHLCTRHPSYEPMNLLCKHNEGVCQLCPAVAQLVVTWASKSDI